MFHKPNRGDIAEVDGSIRFAFDDDILDVFHGFEIPNHLHGAAVVVDQQVATGDRYVLLGNRIRDVIKTGLHGFGPEVVDDNLDLLVHDPTDVHLGNLRELFDVLFELFGIALQLVQAVISGEVDVHDGQQLREIQLEHIRVSGQVVWEFRIGFGLVDRVLHLSQRLGWGHIEIKLDVNGAVALDGRRRNFVHARDRVDLLFEGACNELLDVGRAVARVRGADVYLGDHHLGETLLRNGDVTVQAADDDDCHQHKDRGAVGYAPRTQPEFPDAFLGLDVFHGGLLLDDAYSLSGNHAGGAL